MLDSQQLGNRMSVNSHVSKQKYIHTMEDHAQRRRMNYCDSQQHGRLSTRPPIWKRTYCVTPCLWGSKQRKRSHSDRGTMGGVFSERGQEGSGRKDGRFPILIWLMATQVHTNGKAHPAVHWRFVHCPTKKVSVARSRPTLCDLTDYSCQAPLSMGFSRQELWLGCHALLQGIFLTQGSNSDLLHRQADSLLFEPQGKSNTLIFTFHE